MNLVEVDYFTPLYQKFERISDGETFCQAHDQVIITAAKVNEYAKQGLFSVTFNREVATDSYDRFVKAMNIKARDATGIVPSIDSCEVVSLEPMGFKRVIRIGVKEAIQRVWVYQKEHEFKILFRTEGLSFIATNEIQRIEDRIYFTARYILDRHPSYDSSDWFLKNVMEPTFEKLVKIADSLECP